MSDLIGWHFPPTHGGLAGGFNDPGIAHFSGAPLSSLARETIQNSLDARKEQTQAVHVSFELIRIPAAEFGQQELGRAVEACENVATDDGIRAALAIARRSIQSDHVACLRISDRNTTGLRGDHWRALVKMQGMSHKPGVEGAGGSFGIGKYAPFAVSTLRTVLYWSCYSEDGERVEKFQGKSVLMSHEGDEGETQGTGFFGVKESCSELRNGSVPRAFRVLGSDGEPVEGTSLAIAGFTETDDWRRRIAASVLRNFFYAIGKGRLTVIVEPEDESDLFEMDESSLGSWFEHLGTDTRAQDVAEESELTIEEARLFWVLSNDEEAAVEKQDTDLGHCRLWIRVGEGLSNKVGFVRVTGMLVTTRQAGLIRFSGFQDFAALCVFEDPHGNELLRRMENPTHDQFQPERLPEEERARGRRALRRITDWIRSEVKKRAGPPEAGSTTILSELAAYLPDSHPEEEFEGGGSEAASDGEREPGFGERVTLTLKAVRRPTPASMTLELSGGDDGGGEGDGDDTGEVGGGGSGSRGGENGDGGQGEGDGTGGTGGRGGGARRSAVPISRVRVLPIQGKENCFELSFVAEADGVVRLELNEAGDSTAARRDDVCATADDISLDALPVKWGVPVRLEITADYPIDNRAWQVSAVPVEDRNHEI